jgi:hypothetical protein
VENTLHDSWTPRLVVPQSESLKHWNLQPPPVFGLQTPPRQYPLQQESVPPVTVQVLEGAVGEQVTWVQV